MTLDELEASIERARDGELKALFDAVEARGYCFAVDERLPIEVIRADYHEQEPLAICDRTLRTIVLFLAPISRVGRPLDSIIPMIMGHESAHALGFGHKEMAKRFGITSAVEWGCAR